MTVATLPREASWIPVQPLWDTDGEVFACRAGVADHDLVRIIAADLVSVPVVSRRLAKPLYSLQSDFAATTGACMLIASNSARIAPRDSRATFYFHDVLRLSDSHVLVLVGQERAPKSQLHIDRRRAAIKLAWKDRIARRAKRRDEVEFEQKSLNGHRRTGATDEEILRELRKMRWLDPPEPFARLAELSLSLEPVEFLATLPKSDRSIARSILEVVRNSTRGLSRTGRYNCTAVTNYDGSPAAIVRWTPRENSPPALELKAALEATSPSCLPKPRHSGATPPTTMESIAARPVVRGEADDEASELGQNELSDILPRDDGGGKELFRIDGFEAIAWYQPFHSYDDESWGIYFDSKRLDAVAASLAQDFRPVSGRPHELAARLIIRLTTAHELFHARVEFAAAWLELASRGKRYLPYSANVYEACRSTDGWLEEALANWCAHRWFVEGLSSWRFAHLVRDASGVRRVVEDWLDFSPKGYANWRIGDTNYSWQRLTNELKSAVPFAQTGLRSPLPLEGLLRSQAFIDLRLEDIPVHFVGRGAIGDALFSAPSRREVTRVLAWRGYRPLSGRGKGSHELWCGPDNRCFPIPERDPLSPGVFHDLLKHFGWTKKQYMNEIRSAV